jgi:hypothetical protein
VKETKSNEGGRESEVTESGKGEVEEETDRHIDGQI